MRTLFSIIAGLTLTASFSAGATHLGPIEFGKERTEPVFLCKAKTDAMFIATEEQKSIEAKEELNLFFPRISHLISEKRCGMAHITYTPRETLHQWTGRMLHGEEIVSTHMSIVRSDSEAGEVFIITPDKAPARKK